MPAGRCLLPIAALALVPWPAPALPVTQSNVPVEITFLATHTVADPFNTLTLDVAFTDPVGRRMVVPGFWAGGRTWRVRYASSALGLHRFRTACSDVTDRGLNGVTGALRVVPYTGPNPLYRHGPIRVAPDRRHLVYADGTPFFWLGDTWWMGLCHRLAWPADFKTLAADRKAKGFSVVQIVAGLYPDMPPFDPRGANEAGFPWLKDYAGINPAYFDHADTKLRYLVDQGLSPCIVGAWGYFMPWMGEAKLKRHWRYLVARYGAYPVSWCAAGEANLPYYLAPRFPYDDREQARRWTDVMRSIRAVDPYRRLLTIHPTAIGQYTSRHATFDSALLDFDMLQTPHGRREAAPITIGAARQSYAARPVMPVIDGEASYEMLGDSLPTEWTRAMFWFCMMNGAAGHTYGANGIWQVNRPGKPHGNSPHGGNYGTISWDQAMRLPGSAQLAGAKRLLQRYAWQRFEPHPEWASAQGTDTLGFEAASWIWYPEGDPTRHAPVARRWFRRVFTAPAGANAAVRVSADDAAEVRLNGTVLGTSGDWHVGRQFNNLGRLLRPGRNVLAVAADNNPGPPNANPAGMIARLDISAGGAATTLVTDSSWKANNAEAIGWDSVEFDDGGWPAAHVSGSEGCAPWGMLGTGGGAIEPQCAGIAGSVRFHYMQEPVPVALAHLTPGTKWNAFVFDPVACTTRSMGAVVAGPDGRARVAPPAGWDHDWVLVLERARGEAAMGTLTLQGQGVRWDYYTSVGKLRALRFGADERIAPGSGSELGLVFSGAPHRIAEPRRRVADFTVVGVERVGPAAATVRMRCDDPRLDIALHVALEAGVRRKWAEITNRSGGDLLLLDVELDELSPGCTADGGGMGLPVMLGDRGFAAVEHPAGEATLQGEWVHLAHHPGVRIKAGGAYTTRASVIAYGGPGTARDRFLDLIRRHARRKGRLTSVYTPFGINNQWGACPALTDEEVGDVLRLLAGWKRKGVQPDYFTLDTGWHDPSSDMKEFRPVSFPNGPGAVSSATRAQGMRFGLWFPLGWGTQSCWDYEGAYPDGRPQALPYREGYPLTAGGITFCLGDDRYHRILRDAVLHHVRANGVRFIKFDGGINECSDPAHGHLPGIYGLEAMYDRLIGIAEEARRSAPDLFVMWYWGLKSPFWAYHGDTIFESGLHMEGSGTSATPTLYYRDSVTLAQDQCARNAGLIPPTCKDSLGVWLADTRWGNFMGKERWREALVMDLGRGNLLFPNLWGDLYLLDADDVTFLSGMVRLARRNEALLRTRRIEIGSAWSDGPYGYAYGKGGRGLLFLSNPSFEAHPVRVSLDGSIGLSAPTGAPLSAAVRFPEPGVMADGVVAGQSLVVWLRPFETLMVEIGPPSDSGVAAKVRLVGPESERLGRRLAVARAEHNPRLAVTFADAARFTAAGLSVRRTSLAGKLPDLSGPQPILAVVVRLCRGDEEWRYAPKPVEIVQVTARIGGRNVMLAPVPDGRQHGNTQAAGCSWVLYKTRLPREWSGKPIEISVHAWTPDGVEARTEAWVVGRWWREETRPTPDGYYTDAPS